MVAIMVIATANPNSDCSCTTTNNGELEVASNYPTSPCKDNLCKNSEFGKTFCSCWEFRKHMRCFSTEYKCQYDYKKVSERVKSFPDGGVR